MYFRMWDTEEAFTPMLLSGEWYLTETITPKQVAFRLLQAVRLTAQPEPDGELLAIVRRHARLASGISQPIRDRGTRVFQILTESSKMGRADFCINALPQTLGHCTTRLTPTLIRYRERVLAIQLEADLCCGAGVEHWTCVKWFWLLDI